MNYASLDISVAACIPALLLAVFVFIKDKTEKEPLPLLCLLFLAGAAAYVPAHFAQNGLISLFDRAFSEYFTFSTEGAMTVLSQGAYYTHRALCYFVGIALVEEGVKWLLLYFITKNSKHFNYLFDGIVYSVFISMGTATVENVWYAWQNGWDTLLLRSVSSVPAQLCYGVIMGCLYTVWHTCRLAKIKEKSMADEGLITLKKPFRSAPWLAASIILPVIIHGTYCYAGYFSSSVLSLGFYLLSALLYLICFITINRMSDADAENNRSVAALIKRKYKEVQAEKESEVSDNEQ